MRIFLVCLATTTLLLAGCGGSRDTEPARDAADLFVTAVAHLDGSTACALLAPEAARHVNDLRAEGCARALATLSLPTEHPTDTQVWGDTAQVHTAADTLFLRRFADGWRILGAGCTPRDERPYLCKVDGR